MSVFPIAPGGPWAPLLLWLLLLSLFQLFIPASRRGEGRLRVLFLIDAALFAVVDTLLPPTALSYAGYLLFIFALILGGGILIAGWARSDLPPAQAGTEELGREGIYRRVRHPRYGGLLIITAGLAVKRPSLVLALFWLALLHRVLRLIQREERVLQRRFGDRWREYRREAGLFLPRVRRRG